MLSVSWSCLPEGVGSGDLRVRRWLHIQRRHPNEVQQTNKQRGYFIVLVLFSPALICLFVLNWGSPKNILDIHFLCFQEVFSAECVVYLFVLSPVSLVIDCVVIMYSYI